MNAIERDEDLPLLFTPITLKSVTARNRIVASPMCQYASEDGGPNDWQLAHLGRLAIGGCGIVFGEETAVEARGRKTYTCAGTGTTSTFPPTAASTTSCASTMPYRPSSSATLAARAPAMTPSRTGCR